MLRTPDGSPLTPGKPAQVDVTVIASAAFDADALELYDATDAEAPLWRHVATLLPRRAGSQVLTASYTLPPGSLQALRARMRYGGVEQPCGTYVDKSGVQHGIYDDHDDLAFAAAANLATYDRSLKVPRCATVAAYCDSGRLLDGRAGLGPEQNQPNTVKAACADGTAGTYHVDRSIDAIRVFTADGTSFAAGKVATVEVKVFASANAGDALDLYYTADATGTPTWTYVTTLTPTKEGLETLPRRSPWRPGRHRRSGRASGRAPPCPPCAPRGRRTTTTISCSRWGRDAARDVLRGSGCGDRTQLDGLTHPGSRTTGHVNGARVRWRVRVRVRIAPPAV